jgi:hypothetical protein
MAFTAAQLASLEAAASTGQLMVQLGDKIIRYQTYDHLMMVLRQARADVANSTGLNGGGLRYSVGVFND